MLTALVIMPLIGALIILLAGREPAHAAAEARYIALFTTLVTFFASLYLWIGFDPSTANFQFVEQHIWFVGLNIN